MRLPESLHHKKRIRMHARLVYVLPSALSSCFLKNYVKMVTTQPSSKKVLKIFIRNKELIHCRKKKNSRRKEKTFDSLFLWISSFVLYCSSGKKGYFYPPFPFSTMFYPQSFCRTASYPRFAFSQPFLYNRNITEWKEACRIGPQI